MDRKILRFQTMDTLMEYINVAGIVGYALDHNDKTLKGHFTDAQLELAQNGYQAHLMEESTLHHKK